MHTDHVGKEECRNEFVTIKDETTCNSAAKHFVTTVNGIHDWSTFVYIIPVSQKHMFKTGCIWGEYGKHLIFNRNGSSGDDNEFQEYRMLCVRPGYIPGNIQK